MVQPKTPLFQRLDGSTDVKFTEGIKILLGKRHGKVLWKNMFRIDWKTIVFVVFIIMMALMYKHDISACQEVIEDPDSFCSDRCDREVYTFSSDEMITVQNSLEVMINEYAEFPNKTIFE